MKKNEPLPRLLNAALLSKAAIERSVKAVLVPGAKGAPQPAAAADTGLKEADDVAAFKYLSEDTKANESVRRRQVSELLAASGKAAREQITKKVYKDILLADLDDPYLGLGKTLFANYPFKDEDAKKH